MTTPPDISKIATGRLNPSEPNVQYFPGTPQAIAESKKRQDALLHPTPLHDFSPIEQRILETFKPSIDVKTN